MRLVHRAEGAVVVKIYLATILVLLALTSSLVAQDLPEDELQLNLSGYFDNYSVAVYYPNLSLTKKVSESTSVTGRYLVDVVTAASIKNNGNNTTSGVDGVTSASTKFLEVDDIRHEFSGSLTHLIAGKAVALSGIYSKENDYSSATFASTVTESFAQKNTTVQLGFVHSWDQVFPVTKTWKREKNVKTFSANVSQIFSRRLLVQFLGSFTEDTGHLSDDYKEVNIRGRIFDPVHPNRRERRAAATRFKYRLNHYSSLQLGYRHYWDSWEVRSHSLSGLYQRRFSSMITIGFGLRGYQQSKAFFFKDEYLTLETFRTVDGKLDASYSTDVQFKFVLNGGENHRFLFLPFIQEERMQYSVNLNWYRRQTEALDWFNDKRTLSAYYINLGVRYRF